MSVKSEYSTIDKINNFSTIDKINNLAKLKPDRDVLSKHRSKVRSLRESMSLVHWVQLKPTNIVDH